MLALVVPPLRPHHQTACVLHIFGLNCHSHQHHTMVENHTHTHTPTDRDIRLGSSDEFQWQQEQKDVSPIPCLMASDGKRRGSLFEAKRERCDVLGICVKALPKARCLRNACDSYFEGLQAESVSIQKERKKTINRETTTTTNLHHRLQRFPCTKSLAGQCQFREQIILDRHKLLALQQ